MNGIQNPDFERRLRRAFEIQGKNIAPTLEPSIQPVAIVTDLEAPEHVSPDRLCTVGVWAPHDALLFTIAQLWNPAGSNVLIVLQKFSLWTGDDVDPRVFCLGARATTPLTNRYTSFFRDTRHALGDQPVGEGRFAAQAGSITPEMWFFPGSSNSGAGTGLQAPHGYHDIPYILAPGTGLNILFERGGYDMWVTWFWKETDYVPLK